jgi:hypothetical protein
MSRAVGSISVVAALGTCAVTTQAAGKRTFTLDYSRRGQCPAEHELLRQIAKRTSIAQRVTQDAEVRAVVRVEADHGSARGNVEWREGDAGTHRTVDGDDCKEVVSALALILALALDPDADMGPIAEPAPSAAPRRLARTLPQSTRARAPAPRWRLDVGATAGITEGGLPTVHSYFGPRVTLGRERRGVWSPRVELSGYYARGTNPTSSGAARLTWWVARLGLCPLELESGEWFALPCATFDAGRLTVEGYATQGARTSRVLWYGPGAVLRIGWRLDAFSVALESGTVAPLAHDRFYFSPNRTAYRIPDVAGYIGTTIGVRL